MALAEKAAEAWDMKVTGWTLAATKPEKGWGAIWRIETNRPPCPEVAAPALRTEPLLHRRRSTVKRKARVAPRCLPARLLYTVVEAACSSSRSD